MLRIVFTGGGTGGHIYPICAVAQELQGLALQKKIDLDLRYIGVPGPYKNTLETQGIRVATITSSKLRRYFALQNIVDAVKLPFSFLQALIKMFWSMPDLVFSKGGPGAFVTVLAARCYSIPVIIHESDAVPGLTSQLSSHFAQKIITSFASAAEYFKNKEVLLLGNPIRPDLLKKGITQENAKKIFGFNPAKPLILVIGASQGAVRINDFILDLAPSLIKNFQILHQTGVNNFENVSREAKVLMKEYSPEEKNNYKIVPYFENNIQDAYVAADLIITRAGSSSIFEVAAFGKPAIIIPLPSAANNHQVANAYEYARAGAAIVIEETNLQPNLVLTQIKKIVETPGQAQAMTAHALQFAKPDATQKIAEEIIRTIGK